MRKAGSSNCSPHRQFFPRRFELGSNHSKPRFSERRICQPRRNRRQSRHEIKRLLKITSASRAIIFIGSSNFRRQFQPNQHRCLQNEKRYTVADYNAAAGIFAEEKANEHAWDKN
jgi:hypothetical protein